MILCFLSGCGSTAAVAADVTATDEAAAVANAADDLAASKDTVDAATALADVAANSDPDAIGGDAGLDIGLVNVPDGCIANCTADGNKSKVCGPDGCGSVCGFCNSGLICSADQTKCAPFCAPKCTDKKCGDNGCGGNCGVCADKFSCGIDFLCHPDDCKGSCDNKQCGDNGCGVACGACAIGDDCDSSFVCKPGACKGIPKGGDCKGNILLTCVGSGASAQKVMNDCAAKPNKICGFDTATQVYACIDKPPCQGSCIDASGKPKQCGDDGCGKSCGNCGNGWACLADACVPQQGAECGATVTATGQCNGQIWVVCNTGKVNIVDCAANGLVCGWDAVKKKFSCGAP